MAMSTPLQMMRISNVCCCELLVTSASVVSALASVWPRPSHRPGNYWISRPAPLIYLPIISLHLRHVTQPVKVFVDKRPDINLLNLLYKSVFGVKAEMESMYFSLCSDYCLTLPTCLVVVSPYLYLHISADLSRAWEFPGGGTHHTTLEICSRGSPNTQHPTPYIQHTTPNTQHREQQKHIMSSPYT